MRISRRAAALALAAAGAAPVAAAARASWPTQAPLGRPSAFSFERLKGQARALARRPYRPPPSPPAALAHAIDFDAFGKIAYKPAATLWGDQPGEGGVRFFPIGRPSPVPVAMHVVSGGLARPVVYSPSLFDAPADSPLYKLGPQAGFGGFRVMNADHRTDWLAFLGAAYFRAADPFNQYGLSARGIALNVAASKPEEFPAFTAVWLERPPGGGLTIYALMDGPSVAGAFRIACQRSHAGLVQDITAELSFRAPLQRLGVAPLTSMYWYGQTDRTPADDWRPQIHDSDGLALWTGRGERIWRPLSNPPRVMVNAFQDRGPRGFGVMQRDRTFADYQDDGAFYDRRPSAWVEPVGDWGAGSVQLVEIPTAGETDDNIVAFWTPAAPVTAGQTLQARYRLHWCDEAPIPAGGARVVATRLGRGGRPGVRGAPATQRKLAVDFAGPSLAGLTRGSGVEPVVSLNAGQPINPACYPIVGTNGWRLIFDVDLAAGVTLDMRAYLRRGSDALTETWIYQLVG
ncbi:MAG TPA: glucan biosynthesis protein [Caulobacteraceae bacterium]